MNFSRNIIFITCLLSGICYSIASKLGSSYFEDTIVNAAGSTVARKNTNGALTSAPAAEEILKKYAEELICGDNNGWAANFQNTRLTPLENPCGNDLGECKLIDFYTDFECDCIPGYKFNDIHSDDPTELRTCIKSKSLVTCNPGDRRVAAEKLIVGKLVAKHEWASGTYERVAGLGYDNENLVRNINQGRPVNMNPSVTGSRIQTSIQQYRHDVPINGREYYEQYEVDANCDAVFRDNKKIPTASLSFNYKKNQWQFTNLDTASTTYDSKLQVYSRETVKCVEDVTEWFYTYEGTGSVHLNVGMVFVNDAATADEFQIRDIEELDSPDLKAIRDEVETFKKQGTAGTPTTGPTPVTPYECPAGSYLRLP